MESIRNKLGDKRMKEMENYKLLEEVKLEELDGIGYRLEHKKTKAKVVVISNHDDNKVFTIGFATPPKDDKGIPHIIEHSVLCGSKKFPVKDPFVELVKGSLNTFLNAMTYPDKTVYPIASCNEKDFHNLMDVYLDAVFFPNIYKEDKILQQEGWHYELEQEEDDLKLNGVVYNEMKGVYSSPDEQLFRAIQTSLLKGSLYEYESGGAPNAIPTLTGEEFLQFHRTYYHPSNSYIYLYGDMDVEKELSYIDEAYLSQFEEKKMEVSFSKVEPFQKRKEIEEFYSVSDEAMLEEQDYFSYNFIIGTSLDRELYLAFQVLDYVLMGAPGAPLKKKLMDEKIGKDIYSSYDNGIYQPTYSIIAKNANHKDKDRFLSLVEETLKDIVATGINEKSLRAAINRLEFQYKEADFGRYPKGLMYGLQMFDSWLYDETKPFIHIQTNETLEFLKAQVGTDYFVNLIQTYLLDNTHTSFVGLVPKLNLNQEIEEKTKAGLKEYKESLSKEEIDEIVRKTKELKQYQEEPSKQEDLEKIPMLSVSDIEKNTKPLYNKEVSVAGTKVVQHDIFTNQIAYLTFCFDMRHLKWEDLSFAAFYGILLKQVDTANYTYNELSNEINLETGGIGSSVNVFQSETKGLGVQFELKMKTLFSNINRAVELVEEILLRSKIEDKKRIKEILGQLKSQLQSSLRSNGHLTAAKRASSYISEAAACKEAISGITMYEWLTKWEKEFDSHEEEFVKNLCRVRDNILCQNHFMISYTGNESPQGLLEEPVRKLVMQLNKEPKECNQLEVKLEKKDEGFETASKVQYVAMAGDYKKVGFPFTGALYVLQNIFSYEYLWNQVRVKGGAYGCMFGFQRNGIAYFTSYRDPNLGNTLKVYDKAYEYLENFTVEQRDMDKFIIGTISNMDTPLMPEATGERSFQAYLTGITYEQLQKERSQVLNATREDIIALAAYMKAIANAPSICVVGSKEKMEEGKARLKEVRNIF